MLHRGASGEINSQNVGFLTEKESEMIVTLSSKTNVSFPTEMIIPSELNADRFYH